MFLCPVFRKKSIESGLDETKADNGKYLGVYRLSSQEVAQKKIEKELLKPLVKNGMIRRYQLNYSNEYLLFIDKEIDIKRYPNTLKHLNEFKPQLEERYDIRKGNFPWYRLSNLRNIGLLLSKKDKLFVPMIAPENRFIFIKSDSFICTADVYVVILKDERFNLRYIQGILNSKLMNYFIKQNSKAMDGAASTSEGVRKRRYSYSVGNMSQIPIKIAPNRIQEELTQLVIKIEDQYRKLKEFGEKQTSERQNLEQEIEKTNEKIDEFVYKLYGITDDERKVIEK